MNFNIMSLSINLTCTIMKNLYVLLISAMYDRCLQETDKPITFITKCY